MINVFDQKERQLKAERWVEDIKVRCSGDIDLAIKSSYIITATDNLNICRSEIERPKSFITIDDSSVMEAIMKWGYTDTEKVAVLNFASFKHPGGGFLNGMMAQEEELCHHSILYPILESFTKDYYEPNRDSLNKGLYTDDLIYSKDVYFDDGSNGLYIDVITCAAPNRKVSRRCGVSKEKHNRALLSRIHRILEVAEYHKVDTLILGAYGCGVFGNAPEDVAETFYFYLNEEFKNVFGSIIFAIPNSGKVGSTNFRVFHDRF